MATDLKVHARRTAIVATVMALAIPYSLATAPALAEPAPSPARFVDGEQVVGLNGDGSVMLTRGDLDDNSKQFRLVYTRRRTVTVLPGLPTNDPRLTVDGAAVVFATTVRLASTDTNREIDVYRYNVAAKTYAHLTAGMVLPQGWRLGDLDDFDDDASVLALSIFSELELRSRVAVFDVPTRTLRVADESPSLPAGTGRGGTSGRLSGTGDRLAWLTAKTGDRHAEVWTYNWRTTKASLVSRLSNGASTATVGDVVRPMISRSGRFVAYYSDAFVSFGGTRQMSAVVHGFGPVRVHWDSPVSLPEDGTIWKGPEVTDAGDVVTMLDVDIDPGIGVFLAPQVFALRGATGEVIPLVQPAVELPTGRAMNHSVSGDGETVAVATLATNVVGSHPAGSTYFEQLHAAPLTPARIVDTRPDSRTIDGLWQSIGARPANSTTTVRMAGRAGIVKSQKAVQLTVAVTGATGSGELVVHPCLSPAPAITSVTYTKGDTTTTGVLTALNASGNFCVTVRGAATHVVIDVNTTLEPTSPISMLRPARLMDTRPTGVTVDRVSQRVGFRRAGTTTRLKIRGRGGVTANAIAVALNVTGSTPPGSAASVRMIKVWNCSSPRPRYAASVQYSEAAASDLVTSALSSSGEVCIHVNKDTHLRVDVVAAWAAQGNAVAFRPRRLVSRQTTATDDGKDGNLGEVVHATGGWPFQIGGRLGIPNGAIVQAMVSYPGGQVVDSCTDPAPRHVGIGPTAWHLDASTVWARLDARGRLCAFRAAVEDVEIDVSGWMR